MSSPTRARRPGVANSARHFHDGRGSRRNMDSLKFGSFDHPRTRFLLGGVVGGIVDMATAWGWRRSRARPCRCAYNGNILVNAFSLRPRAHAANCKARHAKGVGNPVLYVGSATGRDGIHGASFARSAISTRPARPRRPTVQVGDPFEEKNCSSRLPRSCKTGAVVAIQDMDAAGSRRSSSGWRRRGLGIEIDSIRFHCRERR